MKKLFFILLLFAMRVYAMLPDDFVYLSDVDPSIIQEVRYASSENFIGRPIAGYKKPKIILTRQAAEALHQAQEMFVQEGYSLVVYDAYRPQKAVDEFVRWSSDLNDQRMKKQYYPRVNKADLFDLKYIMKKSGHSRGSTVDVSIIPLDKKIKMPVEISKRKLRDGFRILFLDDDTVDMGSSFDLFDLASHEDSPIIEPQYTKIRNYLKFKMEKAGFVGVKEEWWHFTLKNEPHPNTYYDFDVE